MAVLGKSYAHDAGNFLSVGKLNHQVNILMPIKLQTIQAGYAKTKGLFLRLRTSKVSPLYERRLLGRKRKNPQFSCE